MRLLTEPISEETEEFTADLRKTFSVVAKAMQSACKMDEKMIYATIGLMMRNAILCTKDVGGKDLALRRIQMMHKCLNLIEQDL